MAYLLAVIPPLALVPLALVLLALVLLALVLLALVPLALVPLALVADPLAGIVVSGSAGFITGLLGAAVLGSLLNGLRERWGGNRGRFEAHA